MPRLSACVIAVAIVATALPVAAQQPPQQPQRPQSLFAKPRPMIAANTVTRPEYETFLQASSGTNLPPQPVARVDLANRVSTLIELGRCTEAREAALEAGERQMALRARQMCPRDRQPD